MCLNLVKGGKLGYADNRKGKAQTEEWKQKISISNSKPKSGKALEATINNAKLGAKARLGQKDSVETKTKRSKSLSKALTGKPQAHRRKKIIINGMEYIGMERICKQFNISRQTIYNRIKSDSWDWHYAKDSK